MSKRMMDSFGVRLRSAREQAGLNQDELAARVNVGRSYISEVERLRFESPDKQKIPSGEVVRELASALGVTSDWLLMLPGAPQSWDVEILPNRFSAQADEAADLIDSLTTEEERNACLVAIKQTIDRFVEFREKNQKYLLLLLQIAERLGGETLRREFERETGTQMLTSRTAFKQLTE